MAYRGIFHVVLILAFAATAFSTLSPCYYDKVCPEALPTIKRIVEAAVEKEGRMGASLLRLHFHDCFVQVRILTLINLTAKHFLYRSQIVDCVLILVYMFFVIYI